jgi:hypothetical protein
MDVLKNADSVENGLKELSLDDQRAVIGGDGWWAGALVGAALVAGVIGAPLALAVAGIAAYELVQ